MSIAPTAPEAVTDSPRQPGEADEFKYWAFISYSQTDGAWASWLLKALEGYRVPRRLQQQGGTNVQIPKRLSPVYRDVSEEASSSDLGEALRTSLRRSRSLIVLCSPRSARSRWVNEEIEYFKSLGRGRRVLCLIVDGVPNAADPSQECFPPAVRSLARMAPHSAADGAAKSEPLAPDVRGRWGARRVAFIKTVAGVLGVGFDTLWRRHRRRLIRHVLLGACAVAVALTGAAATYAAVADAGVAVPGAAPIRSWLDQHDASWLRRAHTLDEIRAAAGSARNGISSRLEREWKSHAWVYTSPDRVNAPKTAISPWVSSQAALGLLRNAERGQGTTFDFRPLVDAPFADGFPTPLGWFVSDADYPQIHPAIWTVTVLAAALERTDLFSPADLDHLRARLETAETIADLYQPLRDGGWNVLPRQAHPDAHATSATAHALVALLELRGAGLGWHGDRAQLDVMLAATAQQLADRFDGTAAVPGWRIHLNDVSAVDNGDVAEGLTLQIYSCFLRAEEELGLAVPPVILRSMSRQIDHMIDSPHADIRGSTFQYFTNVNGVVTNADVPESFLWYSWAIDFSARWLHRLEADDASTEAKVRARRALGFLIVDLGRDRFPPAVDGQSPTFIASETLYALATVHLLYDAPATVTTVKERR